MTCTLAAPRAREEMWQTFQLTRFAFVVEAFVVEGSKMAFRYDTKYPSKAAKTELSFSASVADNC